LPSKIASELAQKNRERYVPHKCMMRTAPGKFI
jgi:hypothetical protein